MFETLRREEDVWYERGRDKGLRLDLEVSIALARQSQSWADDAAQRGSALIDLGQRSRSSAESGTARLEEAVATYPRCVRGAYA